MCCVTSSDSQPSCPSVNFLLTFMNKLTDGGIFCLRSMNQISVIHKRKTHHVHDFVCDGGPMMKPKITFSHHVCDGSANLHPSSRGRPTTLHQTLQWSIRCSRAMTGRVTKGCSNMMFHCLQGQCTRLNCIGCNANPFHAQGENRMNNSVMTRSGII